MFTIITNVIIIYSTLNIGFRLSVSKLSYFIMPQDDLRFYSGALQFCVTSEMILKTEMVKGRCFYSGIMDLYYSKFNPFVYGFEVLKNCRELKVFCFKKAAYCAHGMFEAFKRRDSSKAEQMYKDLVAEISDCNKIQFAQFDHFSGTDLVVVGNDKDCVSINCASVSRLNKLIELYNHIISGKSNIEIFESEDCIGFKEKVARMFRMILSRPCGVALLEYILDNSRKNNVRIEIRYGSKNIIERSNEGNGIREIIYVNDFFDCFDISGDSNYRFLKTFIPIQGLLHELIHCYYDFVLGIDGLKLLKQTMAEELDYPNQEEELVISGKTSVLSGPICENRLLGEFGVFPRVSHICMPLDVACNPFAHFYLACKLGIDRSIQGYASYLRLYLGPEEYAKILNSGLDVSVGVKNKIRLIENIYQVARPVPAITLSPSFSNGQNQVPSLNFPIIHQDPIQDLSSSSTDVVGKVRSNLAQIPVKEKEDTDDQNKDPGKSRASSSRPINALLQAVRKARRKGPYTLRHSNG